MYSGLFRIYTKEKVISEKQIPLPLHLLFGTAEQLRHTLKAVYGYKWF